VAYDQINPKIVSDGAGGALMTWEDFRNGVTSDIYAQRVSVTGVVATGWNVNGVAICVSAGNQSHPQIISDSSNGAIITWRTSAKVLQMAMCMISMHHASPEIFALPWTADGLLFARQTVPN